MKLRLLGFLCLFACVSLAQNRSITFQEGEFKTLLSKAKKENKLIFIDAYTTWCGPCKWMAKNMFTNNQIADYYNANFINAKFDMEKGEGIELAEKYSVSCYPNLLFIDGDGKLVHRSAGAAQEVQDYIDLGETAKDPKRRFSALMDAYPTRMNEPAFLIDFIDQISMTCVPFEKYLQQYFNTQNEADLLNAQNWRMIFTYVEDYKSREFEYLLKHKEEFANTYGMDSVDQKIAAVYQTAANDIIYSPDFSESAFKEMKEVIKNSGFAGYESVIFHLELSIFEKNEDDKGLFAYAIEHGDTYLNNDEKNSISWSIYERSSDKHTLEKAAAWMKDVTESETGRTWAGLDTYASILYKLKNKALAKTVAEDAIKVAKQTGVSVDDYQTTLDLLAKINKL